jgi:hypothetical protein
MSMPIGRRERRARLAALEIGAAASICRSLTTVSFSPGLPHEQ